MGLKQVRHKLHPLRMGGAGKRELRIQFAALPYRMRKNQLEVCLITSRTSRNWILPKGWPMDGMTPAQTAATEAFEEAGLKGRERDKVLGVFSYIKPMIEGDMPCLAMVFPLKVKQVLANWPERGQRRRKWMSPKRAAKRVNNPELAQILRDLDPAQLKR